MNQLAASAFLFHFRSDWMFEPVRYRSRTVSLQVFLGKSAFGKQSSLFLNMSSLGQKKNNWSRILHQFILFSNTLILHLMSYLCRIFATFLLLNKTWNFNSSVSFCNQYSLFYVRLNCICSASLAVRSLELILTSEMTKLRMTRQ